LVRPVRIWLATRAARVAGVGVRDDMVGFGIFRLAFLLTQARSRCAQITGARGWHWLSVHEKNRLRGRGAGEQIVGRAVDHDFDLGIDGRIGGTGDGVGAVDLPVSIDPSGSVGKISVILDAQTSV